MTPSVTRRSRIFFQIPNDHEISQGPVTLVNLLDGGNTGGAFGIPTFIPAEPRFYGVQLTAKF